VAVGVVSTVDDGIRWNAVLVPAEAETVHVVWGAIDSSAAEKSEPEKESDPLLDQFWAYRTASIRDGAAWHPLRFDQTVIGTSFKDRKITCQLLAVRAGEDAYLVNSAGALFARLPAGTFTIAQAGGPAGRSVTLSRDFYMSVTETTEGQLAVMRGQPAPDAASRDLPAVNITWPEADQACRLLDDASGWRYALPTEAQWEYACQAGRLAPFSPPGAQSNQIMWHSGNSGMVRHKVAQLLPNSFGLFDMHGNVREWCRDWWSPVPSVGVDPTGPAKGPERVRRGGAFDLPPNFCSCGARDSGPSNSADPWLGFRMVLELKADE